MTQDEFNKQEKKLQILGITKAAILSRPVDDITIIALIDLRSEYIMIDARYNSADIGRRITYYTELLTEQVSLL